MDRVVSREKDAHEGNISGAAARFVLVHGQTGKKDLKYGRIRALSTKIKRRHIEGECGRIQNMKNYTIVNTSGW